MSWFKGVVLGALGFETHWFEDEPPFKTLPSASEEHEVNALVSMSSTPTGGCR